MVAWCRPPLQSSARAGRQVMAHARTAATHRSIAPPCQHGVRRRGLRGALVLVAATAIVLGVYAADLLWRHNFHVVIPGELYRSGQLTTDELSSAVRQHHIRSVLNLRGPNPGKSWYAGELKVCDALGIEHADLSLKAGREISAAEVRQME